MLRQLFIAWTLACAPLYAEEEPTFDFAQMELEEASSGIDFSAELKRISMTLGATIILGALTIFVLRRFTSRRQVRFNSKSKIQVLEQRALSPKTAAYLLEVDGKKIFFVETTSAATAVCLSEPRHARDFSALVEPETKDKKAVFQSRQTTK